MFSTLCSWQTQAFVVFDVDGDADNLLSLTLECGKCELIIGDASGLIFHKQDETHQNDTGTASVGSLPPLPSSTLRFDGTAADINRAMRDLRYQGLPGRTGDDVIHITVTDDPGSCPGDERFNSSESESNATAAITAAPCALGGPQTTEGAIAVFLSAINRPPSIKVPVSGVNTRTTIDAEKPAYIGAGGEISVEDPDARETAYYSAGGLRIEGPVTVGVVAASGQLGIGARHGLSFVVGGGISDPEIRFSGAIDDAKRALETLTYRCSTASGCDAGTHKITVSVDDNGFTGKGGPLTAMATFGVEVEVAGG